MKKLILSLLLLGSVLTTAAVHADESALTDDFKAKLNQQIDYIGSIYNTYYAPKEWKQKYLAWDLNAEILKAKTAVSNSKNSFEYRAALAALIKSTKDYHVSFRFFATEKATLPFQVKTVEGHTILVYIDRTKLSEVAFQFEEGDELLSMDGQPIADILAQLITENGPNIAATDLALADLNVTSRTASTSLPVPHGPVTLTFMTAHGPSNVQVIWEYSPELISPVQPTPFERQKKLVEKQFTIPDPIMAYDTAGMETAKAATPNNFALGTKGPFLPAFGDKIWQSAADSNFDAYIYQNTSGKLIGVVRIPSYEPDDQNKAAIDFAQIIIKMQKTASALIIDQNNNPGGSVIYLYALASMLSDHVLSTPQHRMAMDPGFVQNAISLLDEVKGVQNDDDAKKLVGAPIMNGYPVSYQLIAALRDYARFVVSEWNKGKKITDPFYIEGVDQINPFPGVNYTKPIILLTNELDFSGGDFFPAIMQDNKRAIIVGSRTSGAGGYVNNYSFFNDFGLSYLRVTASIAERVNKNPIENLGVTPDVVVPITVQDLRNGFQNYMASVSAVVDAAVTAAGTK